MKIKKYGLIGEKLTHSFSEEIHSLISDEISKEYYKRAPYDYQIQEIASKKLKSFMLFRNFKAINVTIPYKEAVLPYISKLSEEAKAIGAVNTIVRHGLRLYGYNTDFLGLKRLIERLGVDIKGKKVVILGSGGTSKTARAVAKGMGAHEILTVSRSGGDGLINYEDLYSLHTDAEFIINTTPVGMYPNTDGAPICIDKFHKLCGVVDAVYNPIRTDLVLDAEERGIPAAGGLYMLVSQAIYAAEIFFSIKFEDCIFEKIYKKIEGQKQNIVLIGMPACGKSTVGKELQKALELPFFDTDGLIVEKTGKEITEIFKHDGEDAFRNLESEVIANCTLQKGVIIATGGGAVLRKKNTRSLKKNGKIYFIDRPLSELLPTEDRPLASDKESIEKRYNERYGIYLSSADVTVKPSKSARDTAREIISDFKKHRH